MPTLRSMRPSDWPAVEEVYAEGIATGEATFETAPPSWEAFDASRLPALRLVAVDDDGTLLGWAAASPTSTRRVYAGVAEHSVYVAGRAQGRGVGAALLGGLVEVSQACGVWTLRSGVFGSNAASRALHARAGFREVGTLERPGRLAGRWRDVVLVERRSATVGAGDGAGPLVRLALPGDEDTVRTLLGAAGLPPDGLEDVWRLWVADADGTGGDVVGAVALERHGEDPEHAALLLRSLVVVPGLRGRGLAARLVGAALTVARYDAGGPPRVGLLTETAAGWFARRGFVVVDRSALPPALAASVQVRGVCGSSAAAMVLRA